MVRRGIEFFLTLILGMVVAWAIWNVHTNWKRPVGPVSPNAAGMKEPLRVTPFAVPRKWQLIHTLQIVRGPLDVRMWRAWSIYIKGSPTVPKRSRISGQFGSDEPLEFAIVNADNFQRLQQGYRFDAMYQAGPGQPIGATVAPGTVYLVLYQPRGSEPGFQLPTSAVRLIALVGEQIMASQPARVTADFKETDWFLMTDAQAQAVRQRILQQADHP